MVCADRSTGFLFATQTTNQITESSIQFVRALGNHYGFPRELRTDGGPCFQGRVHAAMKELGIEHHYSAPYVASGNGLAERSVGLVKKYLSKLGKLNTPKLDQLLYRLNCTPSSLEGAESSFLRFFGHLGQVTSVPTVQRKFSVEDVQKFWARREQTQNRVLVRQREGEV